MRGSAAPDDVEIEYTKSTSHSGRATTKAITVLLDIYTHEYLAYEWIDTSVMQQHNTIAFEITE